MTLTPLRRLFILGAAAVALTACSKPDPVRADLELLNRTAEAAMASADVQKAMSQVQAASTPAAKAEVLRASSVAIEGARSALEKATLTSPEVGSLRHRMVGGFAKLGEGARTAASAFEASSTSDLDRARTLMREGQVEFIAAGQEMVKLAREHKVDLTARK